MVTNKLFIAGITWQIDMPLDLLDGSVKSFEQDFMEEADVHVIIDLIEEIQVPETEPITEQVLDWFPIEEDAYSHQLIGQDQDRYEDVISMKVNKDWTSVKIDCLEFDRHTVDMINILLLEIVFRNRIYFHDGIVVHASSILYKEKAVLFSAPSGTGKSTHVALWQEVFSAEVINDDHPAVRLIDGQPVVFGTPWAGEESKFSNVSASLGGVVVINQGPENIMERMTSAEVVREFFPRTFIPYYSKSLVLKATVIFNKMMKSTNVYRLHCLPNKEAARLAERIIYED